MTVLKDERERGWFHLDNAIVDDYLSRIGAIPFAVYACIARHADKAGNAFPSYTKLQKELGTGSKQIAAALKTLVDVGLMTVTAEKKEGQQKQNIYHLITPKGTFSEKVLAERKYMPRESKVLAERKSNNTHEQDPITPPTPSRGAYAADFERAYQAYPKHEGKKEAHDQWIRKKPDVDVVLTAIENQKQGRKWRDGYVMSFTRWLRGEHWTDEIDLTVSLNGKMTKADWNAPSRNPDGSLRTPV